MAGEMNLDRLIASMTPELQPGIFVFATSPSLTAEVMQQAAMTFRETEGVTAIVPESIADEHGLTYTYPCRCITLNVHSSLEAVGFLAVITHALAKAGIGVNPVSAYFHDHLFIAKEHVEEALAILKGLSA